MSIGSNTTTLSFDDVVSSLLLEEMRWMNVEGQSTFALFARGCSQGNKYLSPQVGDLNIKEDINILESL